MNVRCYPVDGSEPFEVDEGARCLWPMSLPEDDVVGRLAMWESLRCYVDDVLVRVESWRERCVRLEQDLHLARQDLHLARQANAEVFAAWEECDRVRDLP